MFPKILMSQKKPTKNMINIIKTKDRKNVMSYGDTATTSMNLITDATRLTRHACIFAIPPLAMGVVLTKILDIIFSLI